MATSEDWQFNKSALQCHKYMLDHKIATDVTFLVSGNSGKEAQEKEVETTRFDAHRFALISRSPVFYAMLCGKMVESKEKEIRVDDIEPEAFQEMLNFVYTDELNLKPDLVMFILYASKKYMLLELTAKCTEYLEKYLDTSNACFILDQSLYFEEDLAEKAMKIIRYETKASLEASSMTEIRQSTLEHILESNTFSASEVDIFSACIRWASNQCKQQNIEANGSNMRNQLNSCIQKLQFPTMTLDEFGKSVSPTNVLTKDEEVDIFRYLCFKDLNPPPQMFNSVSRYYTSPFTLRDSSDLEKKDYTNSTSFCIASTCNFDFKFKSLLIGSVPHRIKRRRYQHCTFFSVDGEQLLVSEGSLEGNALWLMPGKTIAIKKGDHSFTIRFGFKSQSIVSAPLFVIYKKTLVLKDENLGTELTLTSDKDTLPICGIRYEPY